MYVNPEEKLWKVVDEVLNGEGFRLYDLERLGKTGLRIYVQRNEANGTDGVTSGDCAKLCRHFMVFFKAEREALGLPEEIYLEVSSPGVNKHLRINRHFKEVIGERIRVTGVKAGEDKTSQVKGILKGAKSEQIILEDEEKESVFLLEDVKKASVDYAF